MNPPQVYMCSPSWTLLPPPSPFPPSVSSQCTSPKHPVSWIEPGLATRFIHGLEYFEHYFARVWDEYNCAVVWAFLVLHFFGIEMKTHLFQYCGHCWVFQICCHIECSTLTASSFRIWNSSTGIRSPPLALFVVMLPKPHLTFHSRVSGLGEWSHHCVYLAHDDPFCLLLLY